ncbi:hypothetical protein, partial [Helicobacter pullorum]|uniref:hypothetical protein n=1 Tax=Helicobacter pullorum TaxID=35818 RepID=UPI0008169614
MIWKKDDLIKIEKYNIMEEENKYYVIELDKDYLLECLTCKAPNDFSKNDICFFKEEKDAEWKNCSQENFELNGDTLEINLYEKYNIQFLKINKIISDIQIFIRKYRGLIVSDRRDGFGCRMASMINAMYLSKKTGFKFGYSWIRVNSSSNDSGVILAMTDEEEIFDKKFIDEHSYTAKKLMSRGTYFIENSLENIKNKPYENSWGYFCTTYRSLAYFKDIDKDEYRRECKFLWEHLPFNQRYLKLIDDAKEYIAKLGTDWVAIHVRNGDNVYFESLRQLLLLDVSVNRIIPYQLILKMIDDLTSEGKKIVLFSPDIELTFSLQSFYREKNEHIYIADDFVLEEMSQMERTLYDFALMSKASEIYMPKDSLYSIFAYRIGEAKKAISIDKMYSSNELYDIIQTYNKYSINVHRLQKAASCAYQYRLACDLRKTNKEKIDILNEGLFLDPNNYAFLIEKMDIMLVSQNFKGVDDILKELFAENNKPFFDVLLRKTHLLQKLN